MDGVKLALLQHKIAQLQRIDSEPHAPRRTLRA